MLSRIGSIDGSDLIVNQSTPQDVTFLFNSGVYEIRDLLNNKSYYGETQNLCSRFTRHFEQLSNGTHECRSLQKAYREQQNQNGFRFIVLDYGPHLSDVAARRALENQYIERNSGRCYNVTADTPAQPNTIKPVMCNGVRYLSIHEAMAALGMSKASLKRYLANPNQPNYYYLEGEEQPYGKIAIFGKKNDGPSVLFESYKECVEAGYATNTQNARRKINRGADGWRYAHVNQNNEPIRTPYTLKEGELSYKKYKEQQERAQEQEQEQEQ